MSSPQRQQLGLEATRFLRALRRAWYVIPLCVIVAGAAAFLASASREKQYTASASLLFRESSFDETLFGGVGGSDFEDPDRTAATNVSLVSLPQIADAAAKRLAPITGAEVRRAVAVEPDSGSDVVTISARWSDRETAARMANALAEAYVEFRRDADRRKVRDAAALVRSELRRLEATSAPDQQQSTLRRELDQLSVLEALQTGNAEFVQQASPPQGASAPKPRRAALLAGVAGLLIGLLVVLLLGRLDRRLRDRHDLADIVDEPILATIPAFRDRSVADTGAKTVAFQMLLAQLRYFNVDRAVKRILVTSPAPSEGKSTVAFELAAMAARSGHRVVLLEADLRRPSISALAGIRSSPGLAQLLAGETSIDDACHTVSVDADGDAELAVIPAGGVPPNPLQLLESRTFAETLEALSDAFDLVIVDTPPLLGVPDAIPLTRSVDGVLIVARLHQTTHERLGELRAQLSNLNVPVLGVVANGAKSTDRSSYSYAYEYAVTQPR